MFDVGGVEVGEVGGSVGGGGCGVDVWLCCELVGFVDGW